MGHSLASVSSAYQLIENTMAEIMANFLNDLPMIVLTEEEGPLKQCERKTIKLGT